MGARELVDAIKDPNTPDDLRRGYEKELASRDSDRLEQEFKDMSEDEIDNLLGRIFAERKRRDSQERKYLDRELDWSEVDID
jgi:hypothetical protein